MNYLKAAAALGQRLVDQAIWDGSSCTWNVVNSDAAEGDVGSQNEPADGTLYQGTSGIAWFLAELSRAADTPEAARTAAAGLLHAADYGDTLAPTNFGFHSGRVGIAYVAARLAEILERPEFRERAWRLLEPLQGQESRDFGIDVIAGAAGAIPALLELRSTLGREELMEMACALGDRLIALAQREPKGWSWRTIKGSAVRNLNGLAHGASGIGLAFLELAAATGEGKYLFAAEMSFLYERQFFSEQAANWPDWRNQEIGTYTYSGRMEELRRVALEGKVPGYHLHYMSAWCHGSPGIGLTRLRAFELTGQTLYREEAAAALPSTLQSIASRGVSFGNYSLCHGVAGNCEFPLLAAPVLEDPSLREFCEQALTEGWEANEGAGKPWASGTTSGAPDPSLMLGEAGIGFFYLRLAAARGDIPPLPSPLLLQPPVEVASRESMDPGYAQLARTAAEEYFGTTLRSLQLLGLADFSLPAVRPGESPLGKAPPEVAYEALQNELASQEGAVQERFEDAFLVERQCYELTQGIQDFTVEFLRDLTRPSWEDITPSEVHFQVALGGKLVATRWDWHGLLASSDGAAAQVLGEEPATETYFLLHRKGGRVYPQQLGPFAALLLDALESSTPLAEIVERAAEALDALEVDRAVLTAKILPQLEELYRAGFVDCSSSP